MRLKNLGTLGSLAGAAGVVFALGCQSPATLGVQGLPTVGRPAIDGTVFTIVFENKTAQEVIRPSAPYFHELAQRWGTADAYISNTHPSLVNYIMMTSGTTQGFGSNNPPATNRSIAGRENLADQLDDAGIPWRAYMESMGEPCGTQRAGLYAPHHNPFIYYATLASDTERCREHVVDFERHFDEDLASNAYRYMWITPNLCNDMHDCPIAQGDRWLRGVVERIMASPGYQNGGVIFILFDEGSVRVFNAGADLPTVIISPRLVAAGYNTDTRFDHRSYLATIQDIFRLPRLPTTVGATPMNEFFEERPEGTH